MNRYWIHSGRWELFMLKLSLYFFWDIRYFKSDKPNWWKCNLSNLVSSTKIDAHFKKKKWITVTKWEENNNFHYWFHHVKFNFLEHSLFCLNWFNQIWLSFLQIITFHYTIQVAPLFTCTCILSSGWSIVGCCPTLPTHNISSSSTCIAWGKSTRTPSPILRLAFSRLKG